MNVRKIFEKLNVLAGDAVTVAAPALIGGYADSCIQAARKIVDVSKDAVKDNYSTLASIADAVGISVSGLEFLATLMKNGSWDNLSKGQQFVLVYEVVLASATGIYSMSRWGVEHNTFAAAAAATVSAFFFKTATGMVNAAQANNNNEIAYSQFVNEDDDALRNDVPIRMTV